MAWTVGWNGDSRGDIYKPQIPNRRSVREEFLKGKLIMGNRKKKYYLDMRRVEEKMETVIIIKK